MSEVPKIAIIGGGAGGLAAAIAAAEELRVLGKAAEIHIYEASDKIGRPILASGNGRCNFSNSHIDTDAYRNSTFAARCLKHADSVVEIDPKAASFPNCVVAWFYAHGLMFAEEGEGRLYPRANKASSVLDVLRSALERSDVHIHLDAQVESIDEPRESMHCMTMRMADRSFERAEKVIIACGGKVSQSLLPAGILSVEEQQPVLCPLQLNDSGRHVSKKLENIRVKCQISLLRGNAQISSEQGEAMFRKYGISGICTFNLSRFATKGDILRINFFPEIHINDMEEALNERFLMLKQCFESDSNIKDLLCGMVLPRVADAIIEHAGLPLEADCTDDSIAKLAYVLQHFDLVVEGPADVEHAQVQRGGFGVEGIDTATMRIEEMPQIHVIGEALDVDGPCGGYNLTWAFATGILAGCAAARDI